MLLFFSNRRKINFRKFFVYFQQGKKMKEVLLSGLYANSSMLPIRKTTVYLL
jgi:hypothetical protein